MNETTSLNAEVLKEILSYNIRLSLVNKDGDSLGEWYPNTPNNSIQLKYKQMLYVYDGRGYAKSSYWISEKIKHQIHIMEQLGIDSEWINNKQKVIRRALREGNHEQTYHEEPSITKHYYRQISSVLPLDFRFDTRTRLPATDPYNALINYAYSYLYRLVEDAIVSNGLDPYLGFYHSNQRGGKALVYDMIEPFRPWVDERVIDLCMSYSGDMSVDFKYDEESCRLSSSIKRLIMTDVVDHFSKTYRYQKRILTRKNHIYYLAKKLKSEIQRNEK